MKQVCGLFVLAVAFTATAPCQSSHAALIAKIAEPINGELACRAGLSARNRSILATDVCDAA